MTNYQKQHYLRIYIFPLGGIREQRSLRRSRSILLLGNERPLTWTAWHGPPRRLAESPNDVREHLVITDHNMTSENTQSTSGITPVTPGTTLWRQWSPNWRHEPPRRHQGHHRSPQWHRGSPSDVREHLLIMDHPITSGIPQRCQGTPSRRHGSPSDVREHLVITDHPMTSGNTQWRHGSPQWRQRPPPWRHGPPRRRVPHCQRRRTCEPWRDCETFARRDRSSICK